MERIKFPAIVGANNHVTIPMSFVERYKIKRGDKLDVEIVIGERDKESE